MLSTWVSVTSRRPTQFFHGKNATYKWYVCSTTCLKDLVSSYALEALRDAVDDVHGDNDGDVHDNGGLFDEVDDADVVDDE